jgi:hypothetical protein
LASFNQLRDVLIYDTGCATTVFNDRKWFKSLEKLPQPFTSLASNGLVTETHLGGCAVVELQLSAGNTVTLKLAEAVYQPSSPCNLIAGQYLKKHGVHWNQVDDTLFHFQTGQTLAELYDFNGVPALNNTRPVAPVAPALVSVPYKKMHRRLMHAGKAAVTEACRRAGIELKAKNDTFCEGCTLGKMTDELGKEAPIQTEGPFEYIRVDLVSHRTPAHLGYRYSAHIIDVVSNYHWVKFARGKDEIFAKLQEWVTMIHTQTGRWVRILGIDGGTEFGQATKAFVDDKCKAWARERGIFVMQTTPHSPWMNGKIERAARNVLDKTRSTILAYNIPEHLWTFVMETVVQVMNVLPTRANDCKSSPQEVFAKAVNMPASSHQPHIKHFRAYFCEAYYYIKPAKRVQSDKFTARAVKGRLIGYADLHGKIYWIWNPSTGEIVRASAVRFNEGPDFVPDDDVATEVYEAIFTDSTSEEEERAVEAQEGFILRHPDGSSQQIGSYQQEQEQREHQQPPPPPEPNELTVEQPIQLPTPERTPECESDRDASATPGRDCNDPPEQDADHDNERKATPSTTTTSQVEDEDDDVFFDAEDVEELQQETPVPADNPLTPGMGELLEQEAEMAEAQGQQQEPTGRPRRNKARYGTGNEEGYYAKLNNGKLEGQSFYTGHLVDPAPPPPSLTICLSNMKAENDITRHQQPGIPKNFRQARKMPNYDEYWLPAMEKQDASLHEKAVYDLVPKNHGMTVLPSKWVYDEKKDPTTGITTPRARWVVCGNFDQGSWSSQDLYAAVVNSVSVKTFFALVAVQDFECMQFDFKTAFLNAEIPPDEEYFIDPPPGLGKPTDMVCKLRKALYGLRQSPLYWFNTIKPVMEQMGFEPLDADICLFRHKKKGILVVLYVDDLLVAARTVDLVNWVRDQLANKYELKELGEVKRFLGFDVIRDRTARKIFISQESYIKAQLKKLGMENAHPVATPWPSKLELPAAWDPLMDQQKEYISNTGSLNWAATGTRPDIAYTVSRLAEANAGPSEAHLTLMKHLWRYLAGTAEYGLELGGQDLSTEDLLMRTFADASLADRLPSRHSTGGHAVFVAGAPVMWKTKKQTFVALSTTEAEFANLTPAGLSAKWVAKILEECGAPQPAPRILFTDSLNAYQTVANPHNKARTRCIDIRYKWVMEQVNKGKLVVRHVNGTEMPADGLTKPLNKEKHHNFVKMMGMAARKIPWVD